MLRALEGRLDGGHFVATTAGPWWPVTRAGGLAVQGVTGRDGPQRVAEDRLARYFMCATTAGQRYPGGHVAQQQAVLAVRGATARAGRMLRALEGGLDGGHFVATTA